MKIEEKFVETKFGKICYLEAGEGEKTLVSIHGFANNPRMIRYLAFVLENNNFRIIAPYLPGHGKSFKVSGNFSFDNAVTTLKEFIEKTCPGKFSLFGSSLGGGLAIAITEKLNDRVEKLILYAPLVQQLRGRKLISVVFGLLWDYLWDLKRYLVLGKNRWPFIDTNGVDLRFDSLSSLVRGPLNTIMSVKCPKYDLNDSKVMLLWGKYDHVLSHKNVCKKIIFFQSGHHILLSQPAGFWETIVNFLTT